MATTGPPRPPIMSHNWDSLSKKMLLGCPHEWLPLLLLFGFSEPGFPQTLINFKLSSKKPVKIRKKGKGKKKIWKTLDEKKNSGAEKSKISKIARNVKFFSKKEKKFLSSILTTSFFRVSHSKRKLNLGIARSLVCDTRHLFAWVWCRLGWHLSQAPVKREVSHYVPIR